MPITWAETQVSLGSIYGRVRCEPGWQLGPGWSDRLVDYDLWFIWAGRGRMRLGDGELDLKPGVCLWMRPGRLYLAEQDPKDRLGVSFMHFDLRGSARGERPPDASLPPEVHQVDTSYVEALLANVLALTAPLVERSAAVRANERTAALRLFEGLLMQLDLPLPAKLGSAAAERRRSAVQRAAALIRDEPARRWRVDRLASDAGFGSDHFARAFRETLGVTPSAFIVRARLERARHLLAETNLPVGIIADALGYSSPYFFSRQFKKYVGVAPLQHRDGWPPRSRSPRQPS